MFLFVLFFLFGIRVYALQVNADVAGMLMKCYSACDDVFKQLEFEMDMKVAVCPGDQVEGAGSGNTVAVTLFIKVFVEESEVDQPIGIYEAMLTNPATDDDFSFVTRELERYVRELGKVRVKMERKLGQQEKEAFDFVLDGVASSRDASHMPPSSNVASRQYTGRASNVPKGSPEDLLKLREALLPGAAQAKESESGSSTASTGELKKSRKTPLFVISGASKTGPDDCSSAEPCSSRKEPMLMISGLSRATVSRPDESSAGTASEKEKRGPRSGRVPKRMSERSLSPVPEEGEEADDGAVVVKKAKKE